MRQLTFLGFLKKYVYTLSYARCGKMSVLCQEAATINPRLVEPLVLYAIMSSKQELFRKCVKKHNCENEFDMSVLEHNPEQVVSLLKKEKLTWEFNKVWEAYVCERDFNDFERTLKELIRQKVIKLQSKYSISNYRISKELNLNHSSVNSWLKNGAGNKISKANAGKVLDFIQSFEERPAK